MATRPIAKPQAVKKTVTRTAPVKLPDHMTARQLARIVIAAAKAGHPNAASVAKAMAKTATTGRKQINAKQKVPAGTLTAALTALALKHVLHGPTKLLINHVPKGTPNSAQKPKAPPPKTAVPPAQAKRVVAPGTPAGAPKASTSAVTARAPIRRSPSGAVVHGDAPYGGSTDPTAFLSTPDPSVDPQCDPSVPDTTTVAVGQSSDEANHWIIHASDSNVNTMANSIAKASGDPTFSTGAFLRATNDYVGPLGFENMQKGPALAMALAAVANLQDPALSQFMQQVYGNGAQACDVLSYAQDPTWPSWATPGCLSVDNIVNLWNAGITASLDQPLPDSGTALSAALNAGVLDFGQGPGLLPPGAALQPDGTCKMPDGSILRPIPSGPVQAWVNPNSGMPYAADPSTGAPVDPSTGAPFNPTAQPQYLPGSSIPNPNYGQYQPSAAYQQQAYRPLSTDPAVAPYDPNNPNGGIYAAYARTQALAARYNSSQSASDESSDSSSDEGGEAEQGQGQDVAAGDAVPTAASFPTDLSPAACARVVNAMVNAHDPRAKRLVKSLVKEANGGSALPKAILAVVHGQTGGQFDAVWKGAGLTLSKAISAVG